MLDEISVGVYINLRKIVTMVCHSNNTIEITMSNHKTLTRYCKDSKEMQSERLAIRDGVDAAFL